MSNISGQCSNFSFELNVKPGEERFFLPGNLHGGGYIQQAYSYMDDDIEKIEVKFLWPDTILSAAKAATEHGDEFDLGIFNERLDDAETFVIENTLDNKDFYYFNESWNTYGVSMTSNALIEWAKTEFLTKENKYAET